MANLWQNRTGIIIPILRTKCLLPLAKPLPSHLCRIVIENEEYKTTFILKKAKRGDTGIYTVTAKNSSGTDTAELEIIVLSKFHDK